MEIEAAKLILKAAIWDDGFETAWLAAEETGKKIVREPGKDAAWYAAKCAAWDTAWSATCQAGRTTTE
ncbi:MAG: hypothetical protein DDT19_02327 [Syntrophomonadaceae bacterium]|nr:hypothetical protein [Bacillota bacterium]